MKFNEELANKFIDALLPVIPKKFGAISNQKPFSANYPDIVEAITAIDPHAAIHAGATRMVIVSPNLKGAVIKIPFNGYYESGMFLEFYGTCEARDYCEVELLKYQKVLAETSFGSRFLAETERFRPDVTDKLGVVLIQEEAVSEEDRICSYRTSEKAQKQAPKIHQDYYFFFLKDEWLALCIDEYGSISVEDFLRYCNTQDEGEILDDCHEGNYGYRVKDGTPCIFDFASYME